MSSPWEISNHLNRDCNINVIVSTILDLPPSCIEFFKYDSCRTADSSGYFVVGTYHLLLEDGDGSTNNSTNNSFKKSSREQSRKGSLLLFKLNGNILQLVQNLPYQSAVLDLHFYRNQNLFAVASSTGCISIFRIANERETYAIEHVACHQVASKSILILSITWWETDYQQSDMFPLLFFTTSAGEVSVIQLSADFKLFKLLNQNEPLILHNDNSWTCSISHKALYSGGDDSKLSRLSLDQIWCDAEREVANEDRSHLDNKDGSMSQVNFGGHDAGVTAILVLPIPPTGNLESFLLTGSYDDHVRVFTTCSCLYMKSYTLKKLAELYIGGGVWRLKLVESQILKSNEVEEKWVFTVLASCMHAGAQVFQVEGSTCGDWSIKVLAEMKAHQSMCYASDIHPRHPASEGSGENSNDKILPKTRAVVSTSFYDRLLIVWEWSQLISI